MNKYPDNRVSKNIGGVQYGVATIKNVTYFGGMHTVGLNGVAVLITYNNLQVRECLNSLQSEDIEWIFGSRHPKFETVKSNVTKVDVKFVQQLTSDVSEDEARSITAKIRRITEYVTSVRIKAIF